MKLKLILLEFLGKEESESCFCFLDLIKTRIFVVEYFLLLLMLESVERKRRKWKEGEKSLKRFHC